MKTPENIRRPYEVQICMYRTMHTFSSYKVKKKPKVFILRKIDLKIKIHRFLNFEINENLQGTFAYSEKTTHPNSRFQIRKVVIKYEHGLFALVITYLIKIPKVDIKPTGTISRVFSRCKHQLSEVIFLCSTKSIHMNKSSK